MTPWGLASQMKLWSEWSSAADAPGKHARAKEINSSYGSNELILGNGNAGKSLGISNFIDVSIKEINSWPFSSVSGRINKTAGAKKNGLSNLQIHQQPKIIHNYML